MPENKVDIHHTNALLAEKLVYQSKRAMETDCKPISHCVHITCDLTTAKASTSPIKNLFYIVFVGLSFIFHLFATSSFPSSPLAPPTVLDKQNICITVMDGITTNCNCIPFCRYRSFLPFHLNTDGNFTADSIMLSVLKNSPVYF